MANIKSQKKRILTNEKRRVRNQSVKSELKTLVRQTREAVEAGDKDKALAALRVASRKLDVAVSKGVIHKNQAANRKSKLARRVASIADLIANNSFDVKRAALWGGPLSYAHSPPLCSRSTRRVGAWAPSLHRLTPQVVAQAGCPHCHQ